jgi:hypothetical protein
VACRRPRSARACAAGSRHIASVPPHTRAHNTTRLPCAAQGTHMRCV